MIREFLTEDEIIALQLEESQSSKEQKRTSQQIEAIYSSGKNILVSASAGSGKTFVMVERIMDKIYRGIDIDQLFISTFTVKAASEFKERLDKKLLAEMKVLSSQKPVSQDLLGHLAKQRLKLTIADIGTMDSFTQKIVNQFGYTKGVGTGFRILQDKNEQNIIKNKIFTELTESYFSTYKDSFSQLVSQYTDKKSLEDFKSQVYKIYNFIQSTANPLEWLETNFLRGYDCFTDLSSLPESDFIEAKQAVYEMANFYQSMLESGVWNNKGGKLSKKDQNGQAILDMVPSMVENLDAKDALTFCEQIELLLNSKYLSKKGQVGLYTSFTKIADFYEKYRHMDLIIRYQPEMIPHLELLKSFVRDFYQKFLDYKVSEGILEFADISHLAIDILQENKDVRDYFQNKYHEVMVDEYQDTNGIQEKMLELISKENNRFMVGDIKQAIYGFRHADPLIFRKKLDLYTENPSAGKLILLLENFRSQEEVLSATNKVFTHLMDREVGEIDYDGSQALQAGSDRQRQDSVENKTECLIFNTEEIQEEEGDELPASSEYEMVAKEIIHLHKSKGIPFEDIALLVRTKTHNNAIVEVFNRYNIPLAPDERQPNYLKSTEIMVLLNTLRTIDNPLNDVALVSLLHSPMFYFSEDELTRIRLQDFSKEEGRDTHLSFYEKLQLSLTKEGSQSQLISTELLEKIKDFSNCLDNWRQFAISHSLYDLIWKIYNERYYYDYVGGLPNGEQRQVNLYALATRANSYESTGYKGLSRFVNMIDTIVNSGDGDLDDIPVKLPLKAVKLMTIHKSKGLEFKYVFLMNLASKFNMKDTTAKIILDKYHGIGSKQIVNMKSDFEDVPFPFLNVSIENIPYTVNKESLLVSQRSEEMRLLYVGMTRAEKKLYLVATTNLSKIKELDEEENFLSKQFRIHTAKSFFDWIYALKNRLLPFVHFREFSAEDLQDIQALEFKGLERATGQLRQDDEALIAKGILDSVDSINQKRRAGIELPTLQTPSQIKKLYKPILDGEIVSLEAPSSDLQFDLPNVDSKKKVSGADIGSAMHELMQRIDVSQEITMDYLQVTLTKVQKENSVKEAIDLQKVYKFFETDLGNLLKENSKKLFKEMPFSMLKKDETSGEEFVIRGIVDGFLLLDNRIVLFDYKTDRFTRLTGVSKIVERYQEQMSLYAKALSLAYQIDEVDKYLILLGGPKVIVEKL